MYLKISLVAFLINFFWEIMHSRFYTTCLKLRLVNYTSRILNASIVDALAITIYTVFINQIFRTNLPIENTCASLTFCLVAISISYCWELIALKKGLWEYTDKMPRIFGAGISPTFQIAISGIFTFLFLYF